MQILIYRVTCIFQDINSDHDLIPREDADVGAHVAVVETDGITMCFVIVEKLILQRNLNSFAEAVMYVFIYHYIFNLQYSVPLTFEFLQRAVVKIGCHDSKPTPRVSTLLNSFIDI